MMELIPNRFYQCSGRSRFIIICPWELRVLWFPRLMKLTIQQPIRILSSLAESGMVPSTPTGREISFTAWTLSGKDVHKLENCPVGPLRLSSRGAQNPQDSDTTGTYAGLIT